MQAHDEWMLSAIHELLQLDTLIIACSVYTVHTIGNLIYISKAFDVLYGQVVYKYKYDVEECMIHTRNSPKWINYSRESL